MKHFLDWLALRTAGIFFIALLDSMGVPLPAVLDTLLIGIAIESPESAYTAAALALLARRRATFFCSAPRGLADGALPMPRVRKASGESFADGSTATAC